MESGRGIFSGCSMVEISRKHCVRLCVWCVPSGVVWMCFAMVEGMSVVCVVL